MIITISRETDETLILFALKMLGVLHSFGFTSNFVPDYLITYCKNFVMALPIQLFLVGPLARLIFRSVFLKDGSHQSTNAIQQTEEEIAEKIM